MYCSECGVEISKNGHIPECSISTLSSNIKGYDKSTMRMFENAFKRFDRLTALGCHQSMVPYDEQKCKDAWDWYCKLFTEQGIEPPQLI